MPRIKCPACSQITNELETMGFCEHCGQSAVAAEKLHYADDSADAGATIAGAKTSITLEGRGGRVTQPLPSLCICCGEPSTVHKEQSFIWYPRWIFLMAPLGLPFYVAANLMRQRMTVILPLCHRHRYPWLGTTVFFLAFMVYLLVVPWPLIFLFVEAEKAFGRGHPLSIAIWCGWLVGIPIYLILSLLLRRKTIHVKRITADSITLGGVSDVFADKLGRERRF